MALVFLLRLIGWLLFVGALAGLAAEGYAVYLLIAGAVPMDQEGGLVQTFVATKPMIWGAAGALVMCVLSVFFLTAAKMLSLLGEIRDQLAAGLPSAPPAIVVEPEEESDDYLAPREPRLRTG